MGVILYELMGVNDLRFSPYCWRTRMALAHKGITPERVGMRYSDKEIIAFSGQGKVPVLVDNGHTIADSLAIACHLEEAYPGAPSLFGGHVGRGLSRFINSWADTRLNPLLLWLAFRDLLERVDPNDRAYFLESRLQRMDATLEALDEQRGAFHKRFQEELKPLADLFSHQSWVSGDMPAYADYIVFGTLHWARLVCDRDLLAEQELIRTWYGQMLDLHDGEARKVVG